LIDLSEDSSLAGSVEDLEDKGKEGETTAEEDDIMEVDERPEDIAGNLGREEKGLKRVTRLSERRSVVYRISSDEEEYATSTASASTSQQGQIKKKKGGRSRSGKRKSSTGGETHGPH